MLLWLAVVLRTAGVACGCFYGPYLYLVVSCGGLYIAGRLGEILSVNQFVNQNNLSADFLLLWSLYRRTEEGKFLCDFGSQKVWIILWQVFNVVGIIGLCIALGKQNGWFGTC